MNSRYDTDLRQWVSPFGYLRINAYLPTPRSFSQAIASFIACDRQGIHHVHLVTWSYNLISYSHSRCCAFYSATPSSLLELTLCRSSNGYSSSLRIESCASTDVEASIQSLSKHLRTSFVIYAITTRLLHNRLMRYRSLLIASPHQLPLNTLLCFFLIVKEQY